jgi:hypothetical protein
MKQNKSQFVIMLSAEIQRPKKSQPMKCYNTRISTPWIPNAKKE